MQFLRSGSGEDLHASHQGATLGQPPTGLQGALARRWLTAAKFLVPPAIILLAVAILLPALMKARAPSYEMRCIAQLRQVAGAVGMYEQDFGAYPLPANWHEAIRSYIDDPTDPEGRVEPGSARDPLKCRQDKSDAVVSYLYLNRNLLDHSKSRLSETITPLAVDEYFHENTIVAFYDGHAEKMEKQLWLHTRKKQWEIRRNLDDMDSFAYEPVPGSVLGPQGPEPRFDPTTAYVWPKL